MNKTALIVVGGLVLVTGLSVGGYFIYQYVSKPTVAQNETDKTEEKVVENQQEQSPQQSGGNNGTTTSTNKPVVVTPVSTTKPSAMPPRLAKETYKNIDGKKYHVGQIISFKPAQKIWQLDSVLGLTKTQEVAVPVMYKDNWGTIKEVYATGKTVKVQPKANSAFKSKYYSASIDQLA